MSDGATPRGRRVIFLYPHSVVADDLISTIAEREYEVHRVHDHEKLRRVLHRPELSNALLFVNIDEELSPEQWETWIRGVREDPRTGGVHVGILSYNEDTALAGKYLMDIGVQAGYIRLKLGMEESRRIIFATLAATEAKGDRKHVRADCAGILNVSMNAKVNDKLFRGALQDVSIAGIACVFDTDPMIKTEARLKGIQLNLRGSLVMVDGTVKGMRTINSRKLYVIVFDQPHPPHVRERLLRFIHDAQQLQLQRIMDTATPA